MKIRNGFVSNSSSSSFILRGIEITKADFLEAIGKTEDELNEKYSGFYDYIESKLKLCTFPNDEDDYDVINIGEDLGSVDNGEVRAIKEFSENDDTKLRTKLEKAGFKVDKIKTYIMGTSNY